MITFDYNFRIICVSCNSYITPEVVTDEASVASTVKAPLLISTAPVVVMSTSAALPAILTPTAPSNVNAPDEVVKFEAAAPSILIPAPASTVIAHIYI